MTPKALFSLKRNRQKGMSFIEVLIAMVILVTGILGSVAMQATAKKGSLDALQRSMASALTQDILERMRSNDVVELGNYANTYAAIAPAEITACFTADTRCTPAQLRTEDLLQWQQGLSGLIDGVGCIAVNASQVTIIISWQGRTATQDGATSNGGDAVNCGDANNSRRQVVLQTFVI
ncbi:MAG: type IV pilus modification protein PilV [Colwellia sp.]|nr:type IV pilus modification protein PilV [Colwellia sp.]